MLVNNDYGRIWWSRREAAYPSVMVKSLEGHAMFAIATLSPLFYLLHRHGNR